LIICSLFSPLLRMFCCCHGTLGETKVPPTTSGRRGEVLGLVGGRVP
jgi:hypothetical protein